MMTKQVLVKAFYSEKDGKCFLSNCDYFFSACADEPEANAMGLSNPFSPLCVRTSPTGHYIEKHNKLGQAL